MLKMSDNKLTCVENWSSFFVSHFYRSRIHWKQFLLVQEMCNKIILQQISIEAYWMRERERSLSIILILNNMQLYNDTRKKLRVSMETEQQHKSLTLAVKLGEKEREREHKIWHWFLNCVLKTRDQFWVCQPNTGEDCRKLFRVVKYRSYLAASFLPDLRQCSRMP